MIKTTTGEWRKYLKRFSVNGKCCQDEQLQVVAEPGLKVSVTCLICGKHGPTADTYTEAVAMYRKQNRKTVKAS